MNPLPIEDTLERLGLEFTTPRLLIEALTHRSYINENKGVAHTHNERLEFLGDAVLELAATHYLFEKFPHKPEGELTSFRAALVNTVSLASIASTLGVNDMLYLSKGESKDLGRARQIILANAFEAILGALYLDRGMPEVVAFLERTLFPTMDAILSERTWQDAKSRLQEIAQEKLSITPHYQTISQTGPDHDRLFIVGVYLAKDEIAQGKGKSKQEAEQEAAKGALARKGW
jgi:ribonuclease-3